MPYADPERLKGSARQCANGRSVSPPEKMKANRKTMFIKRAIDKRRFPQPSSIQRHALTEAEVMQLVEGVLASLRARDTQV